jgi:hypothetical protein
MVQARGHEGEAIGIDEIITVMFDETELRPIP